MRPLDTDIIIVGAGPVGLMCAYLAQLSGLKTIIVDKSNSPLKVGRADALNARTMQLLKIAGLLNELYPLGKSCNTSSVWADGRFLSRQSVWWDELEGCEHKHFLMLGQSYIEKLLDQKLSEMGNGVRRCTSIQDIKVTSLECRVQLNDGETITSRYLIGADGSRSFVRNHFQILFEIIRPQITWAVIDGVIETDFKKVPEIIVFQAETSDVAWIPREKDIDRFYVRMDTKDFTLEDVIKKINRAMKPHTLSFKKIEWYSQFSVKESVAEKFFVHDRVFLAGDACHIHSVNGGQGLNTGIADAFNLIWKLNMVIKNGAHPKLLESYQTERQPIARSVIETSVNLVRATKFSENGTHAQDYVDLVRKYSGNITGMGIGYGKGTLQGSRFFDFKVIYEDEERWIYSLLDYRKYTLFIFDERELEFTLPEYVRVIRLKKSGLYQNNYVLVRPDGYIESTSLGSLNESSWRI